METKNTDHDTESSKKTLNKVEEWALLGLLPLLPLVYVLTGYPSPTPPSSAWAFACCEAFAIVASFRLWRSGRFGFRLVGLAFFITHTALVLGVVLVICG